MCDNQQCKEETQFVQYTSFDQIQQSQEDDASVLASIEKFFKNEDWIQHFLAIDMLRRLNKFDPVKFCQLISNHIGDIISHLDNLRSNISKNCLMLVKETFLLNSVNLIQEESLIRMIHKIYEKALSEKSFLKQEALDAILQLEINKGSLRKCVIQTLCNLCYDKNGLIQEMACGSLSQILSGNSENLQFVDIEVLQIVLNTIAKNLEGKRAVLKRLSSNLCVLLEQKLGTSTFDNLENQKLQLVKRVLEEKNGNTKKNVGNFRDFIKQQKLVQ